MEYMGSALTPQPLVEQNQHQYSPADIPHLLQAPLLSTCCSGERCGLVRDKVNHTALNSERTFSCDLIFTDKNEILGLKGTLLSAFRQPRETSDRIINLL